MRNFASFAFLIMYLTSCFGQEADQKDKKYPVPAFFSITEEELLGTTSEYPPFLKRNIESNPQEFLVLINAVLKFDKETFLIADKNHSLAAGYEPSDLASLNNYALSLNRNDLRLREICMPDVMAMDTAAENQGLRLVYSSSYRSYSYQETVYNRHVSQMGKEAADRVSAQPGTSQHQLGTTIDFGSITDAFGNTPEGKWLAEHAWEYGFSLSYPDGYEDITGYSHEIWHYRWIGRPAAAAVRLYFNDIQHYFLNYMNGNWDFFTSRKN